MEIQHDDPVFSGYLALPESGTGAGIVLLHSWWGLNMFIRDTCDMLSRRGFSTLAFDYCSGKTATTIEEAQSLRQQVDRKYVNKQLSALISYFASQDYLSSTKIAVIGFSLGCGFAIEATRIKNDLVSAAVLFYGTGGGKFNKTQASYQGHFAENDAWGAHAKKVNALKERIEAAGRNASFFIYPGTEHWFMEPNRPEYQQNAASLAWQRTIQFLHEKLD